MDLQHFREWADLLDDSLLFVHSDGRLIDVNTPASNLLHRKRADLVGRSFLELVTDSHEKVSEFLTVSSRSRQFVPGSLTFNLPESATLTCRCDGAATTVNGEPGGLFIRLRERKRADQSFAILNRDRQIERLAHEIESRRAAEESVRNEREWFYTTLSSIGDGVIATDPNAKITFLNIVAESLTGWPLAEALGQPLETVFHIIDEQDQKLVENPVFRSLREGVIVGLANHTVLIARDKTARAIDDSAAPIRSADGRVLGAVLVFRDVSDRRRKEASLQDANTELERHVTERTMQLQNANELLSTNERALLQALQDAKSANEAKDDWISVLSHELRTPLTPILGWTRMLRSGSLNRTDSLRGIEVIERNVNAEMRIVEDLLDVSRMVAGKLSVVFQPTDMRRVVAAALDAVRSTAAAKSVFLNVEYPDHTAGMSGDASRLQQVVWNLLSNAIKFSGKGGEVVVMLKTVCGQVVVSVKDNGIGISPENLPLLFKRFRQEDASTTRMFGGLGLGLFIVKHITELHSGTVSVESQGKGKGTMVTVTFPGLSSYDNTLSSQALGIEDDPVLDDMRVLIVDDDKDTLELVAFATRQYGAVNATASSAEAAKELLKNEKFDAIISDLGMPNEDGFAFIKNIRKQGIETPAIALTAYARDDDRTRVLSSGFQMYLAKPADPRELACALLKLAALRTTESRNSNVRNSNPKGEGT